MDPKAQIWKRLQEIQADRYALEGWTWGALVTEAALLAELPEVEAAELLQNGNWEENHPGATCMLLTAIAKTPGLPRRLTPVLLRCVPAVKIDPELGQNIAQALKPALPELSPAFRSVVFDQYPSLRAGHFLEGSDVLLLPMGQATWSHDENFPPLDTVEGRQARLRYLGFPITDPLGQWGTSSEAALIRFQIDNRRPRLGVWDRKTSDLLDGAALSEMCRHRDDPSTVYD
jgi:hypothetical protein